MAKASVTENSRNRRPTMPPMNKSGMKAAISDTLIDTTVKPICRAPLRLARKGEAPRSRKRNMFSIMTMASSTTKPMHTASAINDRLSIEKPAAHIAAQVPASDSGTVTPAAMVGAARRRNRNTTSITSTAVAPSVSCMSWTLARMVCVRSARIEKVMPAGTHSRSCGSSALTRSATSMTLASPCLVMKSSTEGWRLNQPADRLLRTPFVMAATLDRRITVPFTVLTTSGSYSPASRSWSLMPMVTARLPSNEPSGPTLLALAIALRTSSMLRPIPASRVGSTLTRIAGCSEPATPTSATPSTWDKRWAITVSAAS